MNGAGAGVRPSDAAFFDMTFCSIELPVTSWGDFLDVEKVTKDTFRRRGLRFPRLLKTSTLEPPKRNHSEAFRQDRKRKSHKLFSIQKFAAFTSSRINRFILSSKVSLLSLLK